MTHSDTRESKRRKVRHTAGGGHSVDAREVLRSEKAQALIKRVAKQLKVESRRHTDGRGGTD